MKILIGTPVHRVKHYAVPQWAASVLSQDTPCDLLMVNNSDPEYAQEVDRYGEVVNISVPNQSTTEEKVARSREVIRQRAIDGGYDYWMSWECDTVAPPDGIRQLLGFTDVFDIVLHDYPSRIDPQEETWGYGFCLIKRWCLEDFTFIWNHDGSWHGGEHRLNKRVMQLGGRMVELHNLLTLQHL
jgi:hypothetical protein